MSRDEEKEKLFRQIVEQRLRASGIDPAMAEEIAAEPPSFVSDRWKKALDRFWEANPEAHQAVVNPRRHPFTGEVISADIFERQHHWPAHTVFDPRSFPKGYLEWLKTEMKYNPEVKERDG